MFQYALAMADQCVCRKYGLIQSNDGRECLSIKQSGAMALAARIFHEEPVSGQMDEHHHASHPGNETRKNLLPVQMR